MSGEHALDQVAFDEERVVSDLGEAEWEGALPGEDDVTGPGESSAREPGVSSAEASGPDGEAEAPSDEVVDAEALEEDVADEVGESPYDRPGDWYVLHCYAGYENKVKSNLETRAASMDMEDRIFEVVVPTEQEKYGRLVYIE
jgi:transcriptional antiterminator NusG